MKTTSAVPSGTFSPAETERSAFTRRKRLAALLLLCALPLFFGAAAAAEEAGFLSHRVDATILVSDPVRTADFIAKWAEDHGGFFLYKSNEEISLRFPSELIAAFRELVHERADRVVSYEQQANDLREEIYSVQSGISNREEILEKNLALLEKADVSGTIAVEQEVLRLIREIEALKGRLRRLETDRQYASASIAFRFLEPDIPQNAPSSFPWVNTVDFYRFMEEGL